MENKYTNRPMYRATLEYRDRYTHGEWRDTSATADDRDKAVACVMSMCSDCAHRNLRVEVINTKSVAPVHEGEVCMDFDEWAGNLDFEQRKELMTFLWNHPKWHDTCVRADNELL